MTKRTRTPTAPPEPSVAPQDRAPPASVSSLGPSLALTTMNRAWRGSIAWARQSFASPWLRTIRRLATMVGAVAAAGISLIGLWTYIRETPAREELRHLNRLEAINSAWETLRVTHGAPSERGQSYALSTIFLLGLPLSNLDLTNTYFQSLDILHADLQNTHAQGGSFFSSKFDLVNLTGSDFSGATVVDTKMLRMIGVPYNFSGAKLVNYTLTTRQDNGDILFSGADYSNALVIKSSFNITMTHSIFHNACLVGVAFVDKTDPINAIVYADLSGAHVYGGNFRNMNLGPVSLKGAEFLSAEEFLEQISDVGEVVGDRALPKTSQVPCGSTHDEQLKLASWAERLISNAVIDRSGIVHGNDELIWVAGAFPRPDFTGADFHQAHIEGADLRAAIGLTQAQISSACVDDATRLPKGLALPANRCDTPPDISP